MKDQGTRFRQNGMGIVLAGLAVLAMGALSTSGLRFLLTGEGAVLVGLGVLFAEQAKLWRPGEVWVKSPLGLRLGMLDLNGEPIL